MTISLDDKNAFDKIQHPFIIKVLENLGLWGLNINKIQRRYNRLTVNVMINVEKLEIFPVKSRTKGCLSYLLLFNTVFEIWARIMKQEINHYKLVKEEVNLPLFSDNMILFITGPKESNQETPTVDKIICQSRRYRINTQSPIQYYKEIFRLGNCLQSQPAIKDFHKAFP